MHSQTQVSNEVNSRQPRDYSRSRKQRKWLDRAHVHHPLLGHNSAQFGPLRGGCWVRGGLERARKDLDGVKLLDAVEWQGTRQGRPWDSTEQSIIDELDVRALNATDLTTRRIDSRPSWLDDMVRDQFGDGAPTKAGFYRFIGDLVFARRAHALGVRFSQTEAAAVYNVSDRQWRRWMARAEDVGIVRLVQTWESDRTKRSRHRRFGKLLYMLGPAIIERAGMALLEGLDITFADGRSCERPAYYAGRKLRAARTKAIRSDRNRRWLEKQARDQPPVSTSNCLDMVTTSPPPKGRGMGAPGTGARQLATVEESAPRSAFSALPPIPDCVGASSVGPALDAKSTDKPTVSRRRTDKPTVSSEDATSVYGEHAAAFAALFAKIGGAVHVLAFFVAGLAAMACDVQSTRESAFYFFSPQPSTVGAVGATHGADTKNRERGHSSSRADARWPDSSDIRRGWPNEVRRAIYPRPAPATVPGAGAADIGLSGRRGWPARRRGGQAGASYVYPAWRPTPGLVDVAGVESGIGAGVTRPEVGGRRDAQRSTRRGGVRPVGGPLFALVGIPPGFRAFDRRGSVLPIWRGFIRVGWIA